MPAHVRAAAGSGTRIDIGAEASMWVPQEAAGLCRRFVRDFDGYRLVLEKWASSGLWALGS